MNKLSVFINQKMTEFSFIHDLHKFRGVTKCAKIIVVVSVTFHNSKKYRIFVFSDFLVNNTSSEGFKNIFVIVPQRNL